MAIVVEAGGGGGGGLPEQGTLVVAVGPEGRLGAAAAEIDRAADGLVRRALALVEGGAKHGKVVELVLPAGLRLDRLLVVVVGKPEGLKPLELTELGGALAQRLAGLRVAEAAVAGLDGLELPVPAAEAQGLLALGMRLRAYRFGKYRTSTPEDEKEKLARVRLLGDDAGEAVAAAAGLAEAVASARDLVSEPANVLTPKAFADACAGLAADGLEVEVLGRAELERIGMRALLGVAQGSAQEPYVAVMRWSGGPEGEAPVALVGKGVCFDTGGISIKPAGGMEDMKYDMAGAAAVFGAMRALAARKARANVVGLVGLVENMPSGTAQRPGDVVTSLAGKTIEVINTDAEGRLVLADVLWYAQDRFKPRAMVDLATLTGAIIVALGHERAGLFATDEELARRLLEAGEETGELLWRMPLGKAYEKHVRSSIADLKNVGRGREAGSVAGAVFLQPFANGVPWAHLDIAAMAWSSRDLALSPKGATGYGVRLLDRYVAGLEAAAATAPGA
jgi:leucyl aminopeptidase